MFARYCSIPGAQGAVPGKGAFPKAGLWTRVPWGSYGHVVLGGALWDMVANLQDTPFLLALD